MKNSIKKIISVVMCAVMLLAMGAVASSAATYNNPVFKVVVVNETSTDVTVSLELVSGQFQCVDFSFTGKSGYVCKSLTPGSNLSGAMYSSNVNNGYVSVVCSVTGNFSKSGSFYTAKFTKPAGKSYAGGDIKVTFTNCSILDGGNTVKLYPVVSYESVVTLNKTEIAMNYKDSTSLECSGVPEGCTVVWSSSDSDVASVNENGGVYASGKGDATVTCSVVDASGAVISEASCEVTVSYTVGQWLIIILLFGFIWYI